MSAQALTRSERSQAVTPIAHPHSITSMTMPIPGTHSPFIIEGAYVQDLLAQPDVLHRVTQNLASARLDASLPTALRTRQYRQIVLSGMGSSLHAAYPLHRALSAHGFTSHWIETAELLLGFDGVIRPDSLLVGISQSGESAEIVNLSQRASEFAHLVAVTNAPNSRLGQNAATCLTLEAGVESTVSCKTYMATLAVLHWLGNHLIHGETYAALGELAAAEAAVRAYLSQWRNHVAEWMPMLDGVKSVFVTGRGNSLAAAGTGGLILKESTRQHAEGMSAAAFRHGPLEMAGDQVLVLIFEGDEKTAPLHQRLAKDIIKGGGRAQLIGPNSATLPALTLPQLPAAVMPLVEILPIQMLSLAIAARDGFEAGRFERASKITNIA